ncbi:hypothetical protein [Streptomyces cucumeris]|uniref:hypothetical protein n=1 Tax=Streptomyces cucumeris TaxID=2962890 RepID=UPI0020C88CDA|nr:hypothetical protein [Streptomyces sp. NEAU-Y11]MCP9209589.1 hypothetical protein [Streptomyces sp. NEAU-Y11]
MTDTTEPYAEPYADRFPHHEVYGGDPMHLHQWTWTEDDGNGHMGYTCPCSAFRL